MPKRTDIKSIMIIGAGPIVIGQACEFDYSGAQACKALREEGYRVVLVNSNPATIMTDPELADATYIEPITAEVVAKSMGLDEMKTAEINMALIEACINAFEHSKSKENIYITYSIDGDTLTIKVGDKGEGFDSEVVAIPNIDEKINSEHKRGWGLQLMKELMDTVEFESSEAGTTVTMTKNK